MNNIQKELIDALIATDFDFSELENVIKDRSTSCPLKAKVHSTKLSYSYRQYLIALRTKPFLLLAGISGTGKSRIVRELAFKSCPSYLRDKDGTTPGNYCMIEVKPNWHDSSELLGYYSNISNKFMFTKFVKFLVRAKMHPNVPFFVCLDEMNLAPVEQYFAEFLSVLETRKLVNKRVNTGALVDKQYFCEIYEIEKDKKVVTVDKPSDRDWYNYFWDDKPKLHSDTSTVDEPVEYGAKYTLYEKGLTLPDNVFIIGTVNMDDTTHQFSRKVIDRAMTIEMNGGNLEDMFGGSNDLKYPTEADDDILSMDDLRAKYVNADEVLEKCERVKDNEAALRFITGKDFDGNLVPEDENTLPKKLNAINKALEGTPYQVSYRVFNELVIYLAVLLDKEENADKELEELADQALVQITIMKILPRVEGDADMFMLNHSETIDGKDVKNKLEWLKAIIPEGASSKKLEEMIERLNKTEFTRFWP